MQRKRRTLVTATLERVATQMGVTIHIEPEWGYVGQITLPDGRKRYFRNTNLDINSLGASEIARDKDFAQHFLGRMGYPTIPGKAFFSRRWNKVLKTDNGPDRAYEYAQSIGFPVVVKPNSKSQGADVARVSTHQEFFAAVRRIEQHDRVFLVQELVTGNDYRIVVLDDEVISAYQRLPLSVTGNGTSTVRELLEEKQRYFNRVGRDTQIESDDPRITIELKRRRLTRESVIPRDTQIRLLTNANLSTGGDAVEATDTMHPAWRELACRIARDMNLRYVGVDVMVNGTLAEPPSDYVIIEVNAAPGLDHYVTIGAAQQDIVERLYRNVLEVLLK